MAVIASGRRRSDHLALHETGPAAGGPHPRQDGRDIGSVPRLLGQRDVAIARIHTHVLNRGPSGVRSLADGTPDA